MRKLDRKILSELTSDKLTVKRQKQILSLIDKRVDEIWRFICKASDSRLHWYCYDNDEHAYCDDGNGSDGGTFDPNTYKEYISLIGEWDNAYSYGYYGAGHFPTSYLFDPDYKDKVITNIRNDRMDIISRENKKKASAQKSKAKKTLIDKIKKLPVEKIEQICKEYSL